MSRRRTTACAESFAVLAAVAAACAAPAGAYPWEPVPPEHLALATPRVERDADAEVLLWRLTIEDVYDGGSFAATQDHLVRIKLFDARAVDAHRTFRLTYSRENKVEEVDVRTVLPDGSIHVLPRSAIFDQVLERRGGRSRRMLSFAPPALVPGAIIEYHVHYRVGGRFSHFLPVPLQLEQPVQRLELRIRPLLTTALEMSYRVFQGPPVRFKNVGMGVFMTVLENVRSYREEPYMPPEDMVRRWMLLYYTTGTAPEPARYWDEYARERHRVFLEDSRPGRAVREAARAVTAGAADDTERVRRLFDWVRTRVRNIAADTVLTDSELEKRKPNRSPEQTLERGIGTAEDIDLLFAATLRACGLEARHVSVRRRTEGVADLTFTESYFHRTWDVGVRMGDGWLILDPSASWLPMGMLPWDEEASDAIIAGPDAALATRTPISGADLSVRTAVADLALDVDGTLDGTVTVTLTGHVSAGRKDDDRDRDPAARLAAWRDDLVAGVGALEVTEPSVARVAPAEPYIYRCRVHAPGYAQRTGKRLFLQPAFFRRAQAAVFPASERRAPVEFPFPWSEVDSVRIRLPEGFTLRPGEEAAPLVVADVGRYDTRMRLLEDGRTLLAVRAFSFGEHGNLRLPQADYPTVKKVFDTIRERDAATLQLDATEPR